MAERVQLSRKKGSRRPRGTVVCDRSSKWGNPFRVHKVRTHNGPAWGVRWDGPRDANTNGRVYIFTTKALATAFAVDLFALELRHGVLKIMRRGRVGLRVAEIRAELAGKKLGCWCKRGEPCHVDVLLRVAAGGDP